MLVQRCRHTVFQVVHFAIHFIVRDCQEAGPSASGAQAGPSGAQASVQMEAKAFTHVHVWGSCAGSS